MEDGDKSTLQEMRNAMNKKLLTTMLALLTLALLNMNIAEVSAPPLSPYIKINPESTTISSFPQNNRNYTITITTDYTGDDVWGFNIQLTYNPNVMQCIEIQNGNLITTANHTSARFLTSMDNTIGEVSIGAFFYYTIPPPFRTSGPGTLVTITFRFVGSGISSLTLETETKLQGYDLDNDVVFDIVNAGLHPNNIGHGIVTETVFDINEDNKENVIDLFNMGKAYGSTGGPPPSSNWNPKCDFNTNNVIDSSDLTDLSNPSYGTSW